MKDAPAVSTSAPPQTHPPSLLKQRREKVLGLAIIAVAFVVALGLSFWARESSQPEPAREPAPPTKLGIAGFPKAVDPVKTLALARTLSHRLSLGGIVAEGVKRDGTVNLLKKSARIQYAFQSAPGEGAQPPREHGTLPTRRYCGRQSVHITERGIYADPDIPEFPCRRKAQDRLPEPRCSLSDVWKMAVRKGAPKKKRARIEYYRARAGPAWRFEIPNTRYQLTLYGDCKRVLTGREASGTGI